jgi:hypothetical protein
MEGRRSRVMVGPEEQQHNEVGRTVGRFEGQDVSSWAIYVTFNATLPARLVAIRRILHLE